MLKLYAANPDPDWRRKRFWPLLIQGQTNLRAVVSCRGDGGFDTAAGVCLRRTIGGTNAGPQPDCGVDTQWYGNCSGDYASQARHGYDWLDDYRIGHRCSNAGEPHHPQRK